MKAASTMMDDAIDALRTAVRLSPDVADGHVFLAEALINSGMAQASVEESAQAMRYLREAIRLRPDVPEAHCDLGIVLMQLNQLDAAIFSFRSAVALASDSPDAHLQLGIALRERGARDAAGVHFEASMRNSSPASETHQIAAATLRDLNTSVGRTPAPLVGSSPSPGVTPAPGSHRPPTGPMHAAESVEGASAFTGNLTMFTLPNLLAFLRVNNSTGTLFLRGRRGTGEVHLRNGMLIGAGASKAPRLGDILVRTGQLKRDDLDNFIQLQRAEETVASLGALLIEKKAINERGLRAAIIGQIHASMAELIAWEEGTMDADHGGIRVELACEMVVLEALRRVDEQRRV